MYETILTWASAAAALVAAILWVLASRATVPAPPETQGVGALMGGYLISMVNGKRIDLHATLDLQSKWNAKAACAAALSAFLTGLALVAKAKGW